MQTLASVVLETQPIVTDSEVCRIEMRPDDERPDERIPRMSAFNDLSASNNSSLPVSSDSSLPVPNDSSLLVPNDSSLLVRNDSSQQSAPNGYNLNVPSLPHVLLRDMVRAINDNGSDDAIQGHRRNDDHRKDSPLPLSDDDDFPNYRGNNRRGNRDQNDGCSRRNGGSEERRNNNHRSDRDQDDSSISHQGDSIMSLSNDNSFSNRYSNNRNDNSFSNRCGNNRHGNDCRSNRGQSNDRVNRREDSLASMPDDDGFSNRYGNDHYGNNRRSNRDQNVGHSNRNGCFHGYNHRHGNRDNDRGNNRVGHYNHNNGSRNRDSCSNYLQSSDPRSNRDQNNYCSTRYSSYDDRSKRNGHDDRYRESRNGNDLSHFGQKPQRHFPKVLEVSLFLFFLDIFRLLMFFMIPSGAF